MPCPRMPLQGKSFLAPHSSRSWYLITVVLLPQPPGPNLDLFLCQELLISSLFFMPASAPVPSLPPSHGHTLHIQLSPPQWVPISPLPAPNTSPSLSPFPSTAAASKLPYKGEKEGKREGTEITSAAGPGCPWPLCLCSWAHMGTHVGTWSSSCHWPQHLSHAGSTLCWGWCCRRLLGCAL